MLQPRVLVPFLVVTTIWGTTWIVIRDQLGDVPPSWSVTYRFLVAGLAMFLFAALRRDRITIGRAGQIFALLFGIAQFVLNFNFVYRAEEHVTSGLVAVLFALLIVPNALFGWIFLGQRISRGFLAGSVIALAGVSLLFVQEFRTADTGGADVALGIGLTLLGVLSASAANVMQAAPIARALPMSSLLAWGMAWGTLINAGFAFVTSGPPVIDMRAGYLGGVVYLGLLASAVAFFLYFGVIRLVGPAKAAYSSVLTPVIAMGISTAIEGYRWSTLALAGGLLAMAGLVVALRSRAAVPPPPVELATTIEPPRPSSDSGGQLR